MVRESSSYMDQKSFKYYPNKPNFKTKQQLDNTTQTQNKLHLPNLNLKKTKTTVTVLIIF